MKTFLYIILVLNILDVGGRFVFLSTKTYPRPVTKTDDAGNGFVNMLIAIYAAIMLFGRI